MWLAQNENQVKQRLSISDGISIGFQTCCDPESETVYVKKRFKFRQQLVRYIREHSCRDEMIPRHASFELNSFSVLVMRVITTLGWYRLFIPKFGEVLEGLGWPRKEAQEWIATHGRAIVSGHQAE